MEQYQANNNNLPQQQEQEEKVDIMSIVFKMLSHWHYFAISIILALLLAFIFNKYSIPIYEVKSTVLVKDDKKGGGGGDLLKGLDLFGSQKNVQNEIGILQSYSLTNKAIKDLNFFVSYFTESKFKTQELYKDCPFQVIIDTAYDQLVGAPIFVNIVSSDKYELEVPEQTAATLYNYRSEKPVEDKVDVKKATKTLNFGEWYKSDHLNFKIVLTPNYKASENNGKNYQFTINDINQLTSQFKSSKIEPINKEATILEITLKNKNKQKAIDFINTLITVYINSDLEDKNLIASNTIDFIDSQLSGITDSLHIVESQLQDFRTVNKIMNVSDEAKMVFDKVYALENEKALESLKARYYKYLMDYVNKNAEIKNDIVAPATMGIEDPLLVSLVTELVKLSSEKEKLKSSSTSINPAITAIDLKIENTRKTLVENIRNIVNMSNISVKELDKRIAQVQTEVNKLPITERNLINIERKFKINNEIYTFLLQKRAESAIAKASTFQIIKFLIRQFRLKRFILKLH